MASLLHCVRNTCCEDTPEHPANDSYDAPRSNRMARLFQSTTTPEDNDGGATAAYSRAEVEDRTQEDCCQNDAAPTNLEISGTDSSNTTTSRWQFWRAIQQRFSSVEDPAASSTDSLAGDTEREFVPILAQASSFDSCNDNITIQNGLVVLPGSELQLQMAAAMAGKLEEQDDECVICMEGFDPTNPRMPTLCGCGENKTYFHLPCLYQWIEQSKNCPSCRKKLRWEEF